MRKLRIGVWLKEMYLQNDGGGFGYYDELIDGISRSRFESAEICFLGNHQNQSDRIGMYRYHRVQKRSRLQLFPSKLLNAVPRWLSPAAGLRDYGTRLAQQAEEQQYQELLSYCDVIYYPVPMCQFENFPYIYTLWDLGHFNTYAFPEISGGERYEYRRNYHDKILSKALMVFCESETGKNEAVHYLRINQDRIKVLPLFPSKVVSEETRSVRPPAIDERCEFIHYPAQFWAHKNHYNLLTAFREVSKQYPSLCLVLTGSDKGNKPHIDRLINEYHLSSKIINLGFVTVEELKWIYLHSKGLVMPTFLGPSNMPPLEALSLHCPVAVSDLPGHREQLGDAAIYFNPMDAEEIGRAIMVMVKKKKKKVRSLRLPSIESTMKLLDDYFRELTAVRRNWK